MFLTLAACQPQNRLGHKKNYYVIILHDDDNKKITEGYIHLLSNDVIVNDIMLCEWDLEEKKGIHKIPKNGLFKIDRLEIEAYNQIKSDSISIIYRCNEGLGTWYRLPLGVDTVRLYNVKKCK